MKTTLRSATTAVLFAAAAGLAGTAANAAPAGQFSPLKSVVQASGGAIEQVDHRWGRRCYRQCHVGRHGRLWCTWHCYRPRRWW